MRLKWYAIILLLKASVAMATTAAVGLPGPGVVKISKAIFSGKVNHVFLQPQGIHTICQQELLKVVVDKSYKGDLKPGQTVYLAADEREMAEGRRYVFLAIDMNERYSDQCSLGDLSSTDDVRFYLAPRYQSAYELVERSLPNGEHETLFLVPQCERYRERLFAPDPSVLFEFKDSGIKRECPLKAGNLRILEHKIEEFQKMRAPWEGPAH